MSIPDETLMAYADDELAAAARETVDAAMREDPQIARRIEYYRRQREQLRSAFDPVLQEPVPGRLIAAAQGMRSVRPRRRWVTPELGAVAASLLVGAMLSWGVLRLQGDPSIIAGADGLVAAGALSRSLSGDLASEAAGGPVRLGLSFRDRSGSYCRTFSLGDGDETAGLACRKAETWQVELATRGNEAADSAAYRHAGSPLPAELRSAIEARIAGEPLDATEEQAARARGWHD